MRGNTNTMIIGRRIRISEDDMARLKALVRQQRVTAGRDQNHLVGLDQALERAEVIAAKDLSPVLFQPEAAAA
jgi:hypothetical protein